MAPVKKEGWVSIYKGDRYDEIGNTRIYKTKEEALNARANRDTYMGTVKVEWEE